jgi:UDP-N-acetylmuramoylalanine--D-glutamate ligase
MVNANNLNVIVGLGKTGLSCLRFLLGQGKNVVVMDSRKEPPGLKEFREHFPQIPLTLGFDEKLLDAASMVVVSPGVSIKEPAIAKQFKRQIPIVGDIELFAQQTIKPVIGITGSNGKSTVTSLVGHLAMNAGLKVKVGGNLGTPALDLLDDSEADLYVLELSSFQLETTYSLKCLSAVILNICPDHQDRYANMQEYINAKLRIYQSCGNPIINLDDPCSYQSFQFSQKPSCFTLGIPSMNSFGLRDVKGNTYLAHGDVNLLSIKHLNLRGQHQYANVLASLAIGNVIGLPMESMLESLKTFKGLPHRCQWVAKVDGIDWYNDSKATNIASSRAAIIGIGSEIKGKLILLAGGQGKNADFSELYNPVEKYVKKLILFGQDKHVIANALKGATDIVLVSDLSQAVSLAKQSVIKDDVVVLSPACASYDMFNNFEHRGEVFIELVKGLFA